AYQAGADVRATFRTDLGPPPLARTQGGLQGVRGSAEVLRAEANPGHSNIAAVLLGVNPATFPEVAAGSPSLGGDNALAADMRLLAADDPDGLALPGRPTSLSIWVWSSGLDTGLRALVTDGTGRPADVYLGDLGTAGWRKLSAALAWPAPGPAYPLRVRSLTVPQHTGGRDSGDIALSDLGAGDRVAEPFTANSGWWQQPPNGSQVTDLTPGPARPRDDGRPSLDLPVLTSSGPVVLRPSISTRPLPVLVSGPTLDKLGVGTGEPFPVHVNSPGMTVVARGRLDLFPTLYPGADDFMVAPLESTVARLAHDGGAPAPNELWLRLEGSTAAVDEKLNADPAVQAVADRSRIQGLALADPQRQALALTLALGFGAALAIAVIAFGLHFLAAARTRNSDYAVLQANGLSRGMMRRGLWVEQTVLLLHSLVSGIVLGLILAVAVLPALALGSSAFDLIPPTPVTVGWVATGVALVAVVVVALAAGWLVRRAAARIELVPELRRLA
ncbi:MAG: FtsX-like permease family protein, partial [Candidatus Dormibacteraeota bacterium]|nr:FtsX-like permease family protein [Candidatus Dormibacteraeota bacterium]